MCLYWRCDSDSFYKWILTKNLFFSFLFNRKKVSGLIFFLAMLFTDFYENKTRIPIVCKCVWVSESFYELMKMGNKNDKSKSKLTKKKILWNFFERKNNKQKDMVWRFFFSLKRHKTTNQESVCVFVYVTDNMKRKNHICFFFKNHLFLRFHFIWIDFVFFYHSSRDSIEKS